MNEEILAESLMKIPGVLKSNEIPNARYMVYNGDLLIEMYNTTVYLVKLNNPISNTMEPIGFNIIIDNKVLIPQPLKKEDINTLFRYYNYYKNIPYTKSIIAQREELENDPAYSELMKLKSAEGMKFFKLPNDSLYGTSFIPVFNGFPYTVKGDNISIKVYTDDIEGYSVVEYSIYKTKIKDTVKLYFRILNI